jgi:hypothetical protein
MSNVAPGWVKSTFCTDTSCLEARAADHDVLVRDGKHPDGPSLRFSLPEWNDFLDGIANGDFRF